MIKRLILALLIHFNSNAQTYQPQPRDFEILNYVLKSRHENPYLVSGIDDKSLLHIKKLLKHGSFVKRIVDENDRDISEILTLSKKDRRCIKKEIRKLRNFKWSNTDIQNLQQGNFTMITYDSSLLAEFGVALKYHVIPPIYLKNGDYCVVKYSILCDYLCGRGSVSIYKKTPDGWEYWLNLYNWVS